MPVEILSYQNAIARSNRCPFADAAPIDNDGARFVVGCFAPVHGQVVSYRPFRTVDEANEIISEDPSKIQVDIRYSPEQKTVCTLFCNGMDPDISTCSKAQVAQKVDGKTVRTVVQRKYFKPDVTFYLRF